MAVESVASAALCFVVAPPTHQHTHTHKQPLFAGTQRANKRPKVCNTKLLLLLCCLRVAAASFDFLLLLGVAVSLSHSLSLFAKLHIM